MAKDPQGKSRRQVLEGILTASAGALAMSAIPATAEILQRPTIPTPTASPVVYSHSRFSGGTALATASPTFDNVNALIDYVSKQTGVPAATVHKALATLYPSAAKYIVRSQGLSEALLAKVKSAW